MKRLMFSMNPFVFGICGWKNAGKTTLMVALIKELTARGFRVATVKHAHHGFDIDHPGRDSHRHRTAGAQQVAVVSSRRVAIMRELGQDEQEPTLDEIIAQLSVADVILVEGYKSAVHPKIEVRRNGAQAVPSQATRATNVKAVVCDVSPDVGVDDETPVFSFCAIADIADFILEQRALV